MLVINRADAESSTRQSNTYGTFDQRPTGNVPPVIVINTHGKAIRLVLSKSGFYILSQLITPLEHLFVSYQFARLGSDGEAAYTLILTSRGVLNTLIATVSAKLSSEISKAKGKADKGQQSYSVIGEKFRVGIALSFLESLIAASLFCFAADPLYSLLGQSPKAINIAVPYLQRYALATIAKGIANPHNAVANGLLNPKLSWFIRTLCVVVPNAIAYFYYRPEQGNTEVFAYAAIAQSILNTLIMTGIMKVRSGYQPYKLFTLTTPSREAIKKFFKELKHLFRASLLYALQTMCELSVLFAQAVYVKSRESEEALAFYGAGSQIIMFVIAGAMGFHFTAMNHSGVRLAHNRGESWLIAKAGLFLGTIPPLIATSLLLSIPQEISKAFVPPASYNSTSLNPELFGTLGPLLTGSTFFDTLRLGAGILLINYNEHLKPAVRAL